MAKKRDRRLYLRENTWWARIKTEDKTKRVSTGCKDYDAASLRADELEKRAASPAYRGSTVCTVLVACERFINHCVQSNKAAATIRLYKTHCGHLIRVLGEDTPLSDIDPKLVYDLVAKRQAEGAKNHTISLDWIALSQVLRLAKYLGQYSGDISGLKPLDFKTEYEPRKVRLKDYTELQAVLDQLPPIRAAHICYLVATGARWTESVNAERSDINLENKLILVKGTKTKKSYRQVPILDLFRPCLDFVLSVCPKEGKLFPYWRGQKDSIPNACRRAGLPHLTAHDFRRTAGGWLRANGVPPDIVGLFLGHTTGDLVESTYGTLEAGEVRDLMVRLLGGQAEPERCARIVPPDHALTAGSALSEGEIRRFFQQSRTTRPTGTTRPASAAARIDQRKTKDSARTNNT